jgi:hypothetical protein
MAYLGPETSFEVLENRFEEEAKIFRAHDIPDWKCWKYNVHYMNQSVSLLLGSRPVC